MSGTGLPRLLVLTDRTQTGGRPLADVVAAAVQGGARGVVLREKDRSHDERAELADELRPIVHDVGGTFIVASDPSIDADGVHLAQSDPWPGSGSDGEQRDAGGHLVGRSCHGLDELGAAEAEGCDFVVVARVYPSLSKPGYRGVLGPAGLEELCAAATTDVVALGGLNWLNIGSFRPEHRPYGVALMGEVMRSVDPGATVARIFEHHPELAA